MSEKIRIIFSGDFPISRHQYSMLEPYILEMEDIADPEWPGWHGRVFEQFACIIAKCVTEIDPKKFRDLPEAQTIPGKTAVEMGNQRQERLD
jgi:hypothetical protein